MGTAAVLLLGAAVGAATASYAVPPFSPETDAIVYNLGRTATPATGSHPPLSLRCPGVFSNHNLMEIDRRLPEARRPLPDRHGQPHAHGAAGRGAISATSRLFSGQCSPDLGSFSIMFLTYILLLC